MLAHSFKLLGLFLSLSIFASAAPVGIDLGIVDSSPAVLFRRVSQGEKNECPWPSVWIRRECQPLLGPRAWREVCDYRARPPLFTHLYHDCPENHLCVPQPRDDDGDQSIKCISEEDDSGSPKRKKQKVGEAQTGSTGVVTAPEGSGSRTVEEDLDAVIAYDLPDASIWAEFTSLDHNFVVAPNSVIVGKIKGTNITVCKGVMKDPIKARTCYPIGKHDLKGGQKIHFTYGLTGGQSGYFHWAAIRNKHDELR